jgi:hypothetical protein
MRFAQILAMTLIVAIAPSPAAADDVVVDCAGATPGAFPTISAALATLDLDGPHRITVFGVCAERLGNADLTANGGPSVTCDSTALVAAESATLGQVRCARIEREHGPPRPGAIKR